MFLLPGIQERVFLNEIIIDQASSIEEFWGFIGRDSDFVVSV